MKFLFIIFLSFVIQQHTSAQKTSTHRLSDLNTIIDSTSDYDDDKLYKIELLRKLPESENKNELYTKNLKLYYAYSVFKYDSAYAYARKLQDIANALDEPELISYSKLKINFLLLSAGMFKEVIDSLKNFELSSLSRTGKAEYFTIMARCYYDLAEYDNDILYKPLYNQKAGSYLDSSLVYYAQDSFGYLYYSGLKNLKSDSITKAAAYFRRLMHSDKYNAQELAVTASTFSDYYLRKRNIDSALYLLVIAAEADIKSSTKETSATYNLATLLYRRGDVRNASIYIKKASVDARNYGARQRMVQLSSIIPLIEGQQLTAMANEKRIISGYAFIITIVLILLIILTALVIIQVRRLKFREKEIQLKNTVLAQIAEEKEWLLKEVHHRVKNNLQVVMSLLNTQSDYSDNAASYAVIRESRQRMYSMSLIHQKLYQTDKMTLVNMSNYIPELVDFLKDSFADGDRIRFELQIASIDLDISQAVPVGLILNEIITNSIKYAFIGMPRGIIRITMSISSDDNIMITLHDNGVGLPTDFDPAKKGTMGMQLIRTLADQLGGKLSFRNDNGLLVQLTFTQKLIAYRMQAT